MEMQLDMNSLDKPCTCNSKKLAGNCCKKDEKCPCGSGEKVSKCCVPEPKKVDAPKKGDAPKAK